MIIRRVLLALITVLIASCGSEPDANNKPQKDSTPAAPKKIDSIREGLLYPKSMNIERKSAYDSFFRRIGDSVYYCSYKGKLESADTMGNNRHFLFDLQAEYIIDEIYFHPMADDRFFVAWQETDHTGVKSYFAVYTRGKDRPDWQRREEAPSPGQPVIHNGFTYVTTLGMVAKLDINTGEPVWLHDSLFDPLKLSFKKFNTPLVYNQSVCFFDSPIRGKKNRADSIWVNDVTGKIGK